MGNLVLNFVRRPAITRGRASKPITNDVILAANHMLAVSVKGDGIFVREGLAWKEDSPVRVWENTEAGKKAAASFANRVRNYTKKQDESFPASVSVYHTSKLSEYDLSQANITTTGYIIFAGRGEKRSS